MAQKPKRVKAEYTYQSDNMDESRNQILQKAFQRAQQEALKEEFGERVDGRTIYSMGQIDGHESVTFHQYGGTEVRADWLKTIKKEVRGWSISNDGFLIVTVYVEGKAREVKSAGVDFEYHLLRNGTELRNEDTRFKDRDQVFLWFKAPVDGHLTVYLVDDEKAYCALPYQEDKDGICQIKANKEYVFFSEKHASDEEKDYISDFKVVTNKTSEFNTLYVIFSPNYFTKKQDNDGEIITDRLTLVRNINAEDFQDWLYKCQKDDSQMKVKQRIITITK